MSIRLRIAFSTASIMLISLIVLGSGIYVTMSRNLRSDVDTRLNAVSASYRQDPGQWLLSGGRITLRTYPDPFTSSGVYIQILNTDGGVEIRSENLGEQILPINLQVFERNLDGEPVLYTVDSSGQELRVYSAPIYLAGRENLVAVVQVAESLQPVTRTLGNLRRNLITGGILSTLIAAFGAWLVGDAAMRPLSRMAGTARAVGRTGDLSRRLDSPRTGDEAQLLAETFNDMLARLEETFNAQRRFVADASHELRTPLTALRANSDIMLKQLQHGEIEHDDLTEGLEDVQAEVDRMTRLVQNLLILARADVGWRPEMEALDLVDIVRDAARIASPLTRGQRLELDAPMPAFGEPSGIFTLGNADQLTQLILILLDNAFSYSPPDTDVTLAVNQNDDDAVIEVTDAGPGIAEEHLKQIFERFFRADDARMRASGGAGLGLSIARWIVNVHGGEVEVDSTVGEGTTFTIRLPLIAGSATNSTKQREAIGASASA